MRNLHAVLLTIPILALAAGTNSFAAHCIEYGDYLHPVGIADTPGTASGVALAGGYAFIADGPRGLQVVDISDPANPWLKGALETPGEANRLSISGGFLYLADGSQGLRVIDIADPGAPRIVGAVDTPGDARDVALRGDFAYVADGHSAIRVVDVSDPTNPRILGFMITPGDARGIEIAGHYAFVTADDAGLAVVEIIDPAHPEIVAQLQLYGPACGIAIEGSYAYVADGGGMQIIDITFPRLPRLVGILPLVYARDVAVAQGLAYVADYFRGLCVIDVSDPSSPRELGHLPTPGDAVGVAAEPGLALVAESEAGLLLVDASNPAFPPGPIRIPFGGWGEDFDVVGSRGYYCAGDGGFFVLDLTNPTAPSVIGVIQTSHWSSEAVVEEPYAYLVDGDQLFVIDVSDPSAMRFVASGNPPGSLLGIAKQGDYVYVSISPAGYGLWIVDVSDPTSIRTAGWLEMPGDANDVDVAGDYAYVADGTHGVEVVDVSTPESPNIVNVVDTGHAKGITVVGTYAYAALREGLVVIDVSDPLDAHVVGRALGTEWGTDVNVRDGYAYLGCWQSAGEFGAMQIFDISDPTRPRMVASLDGATKNVGFHEGLAYAASGDQDLRIFSAQCAGGSLVPDPDAAVRAGVLAYPNPSHGRSQIRLDAPRSEAREIEILDAGGRLVRRLARAASEGHPVIWTWDGRDSAGRDAAAGVYLVRVPGSAHSESGRIILIR